MKPDDQRKQLHQAIFDISQASNHERMADNSRSVPDALSHRQQAAGHRAAAMKRVREVLSALESQP